MSGDHAPEERQLPDLALTVGVYAAILASVFPLLRVVQPGLWTIGVLLLPAVVLACGFAIRRFRVTAIAVSLIELVVWALLVTVVFLSDSAAFGFLPMTEAFGEAAALVRQAIDLVITGSAPLAATFALTFLIVTAIGLLTIGIDHVVLTARMPLLASVGLIVVSLIPSLAVPSDVDVPAFVILAAALLYLLRAETRGREASGVRLRSRETAAPNGGVAAAAAGIGTIAVVIAVVAAPLLPASGTLAGAGAGTWNSIDPTLQLGKDLRRPTDGEVLTLRTDAASAPYLRAATLSSFDGSIWRPDSNGVTSLGENGALGEVHVAEGVRLTRFTTEVEVTNLLSGWLPVAYPAVQVTGLDGDWQAQLHNRTVSTRSANANGQTYTIVSDVPRPTLEQIRSSSATAPTAPETTLVPVQTPAIVHRLAAEVTASADTDYDRLIALQTWFRTSFDYSLDAPVADGFDGTGVQAVAEFLQAREGYCIHFSGAFALMARTLGMSARVVVGYLPGTATTGTPSHERVFTVMNSQLHAWPEVHFEGIGWVPFEPTATLGTPTRFSSESSADPDEGGTELTPEPTESAVPTPTPPSDPTEADEDVPTTTDALGAITRPLPWVGLVLGLMLLLAVPAAFGVYRRRELLSAARGGEAAAAWRSVQDAAIDLAIPQPPGESPRAFGQRLAASHGAPPEEMRCLVHAIEWASYSGAHSGRFGADLGDAVLAVRGGMAAAAPPSR
ncbi:MAG: DUF3488 and transglutaminase-like domain-containing protein, partial [Microbacterium sp.]|uniref:transglutaminase family protein n=1 Tax=Microbacterium sp. TaxID=51671 RepID=UPI0039E65F20